MSQTLQELMNELRVNPQTRLLVLDFDDTISYSSDAQSVSGRGEYVHPEIGVHLNNIAAIPNIKILIISKGTDQELAHQLFPELSEFVVAPATDVYQYLQNEQIQQQKVDGSIQKADLIQSIRLGVMNEIDDLNKTSPSSRIIGFCDDSEQPILECVPDEYGNNTYNFPVLLVPHDQKSVSRTIDYFAILEFLAQYQEYNDLTRPIKEKLTTALQAYKANHKTLCDYNNQKDYDKAEWERLREQMQKPYQEALTQIITQIPQVKETFYAQLKEQLVNCVVDPRVQTCIKRLITQTDQLKSDGVAIEKLTQILHQTNQFLQGDLELPAYQKLTDSLRAEPSPGIKALGIIMMTLAAVAVAAGLVFAPAIMPLGAGICAAGIGLFAAGVATFKKGNNSETELTQEMGCMISNKINPT